MNKKSFHYVKQWLYLRWRKWVVHPVCGRLYQDKNRDAGRSLIVAGTGRSGTTWAAKIISSQISCRVMFEPFHAGYVDEFSPFNYFQYMRPNSANPQLYRFCERVLSGDIRHPWIDRELDVIWPQFRLIKEIRANLFLKWLHLQFPQTPLIFIIRHPCAVVLSRMQLDWAADGDIKPFLAQEPLVHDFLADKMEIIERAKSVEQKHAVIWSISNLVPLRQFGANELNIVFYENLAVQPEVEIPRIFQAIGQEYTPSVFREMQRPSTSSTSSSAVMMGADKVAGWRKKLSTKQIDDILSTAAAFGLDYLYGDSDMHQLREN